MMSDPAAGREAMLTWELTIATMLCCCHSRECHQASPCILTTPSKISQSTGSSLQVRGMLGLADYFLLIKKKKKDKNKHLLSPHSCQVTAETHELWHINYIF